MLVGLLVASLAIALARWWTWPSREPAAPPTAPRTKLHFIPQKGTPNVILITIDTLRPDRLSAYGYKEHSTPHLDRLAQEGVLFENAFCDVTWTTPSMSSVMTGRYATVHGVRSSFNRLSTQATTLAEMLHANGIHTAAIVGSYLLSSMYGFDQGFDFFDEDFSHPLAPDAPRDGAEAEQKVTPGPELFGKSRVPMLLFIIDKRRHDAFRPDNELSDRAIRWLRDERHEPFFLWLHYFGPHEKPNGSASHPLTPSEESARYDRDVLFADAQVGRVLSTLDELGLTGHTAVILHADHGESIYAHHFFGHGVYVYDPTQHIPLMMRLPGSLPAGGRIHRLVRNLDLFPTILELMRVKRTVPVDGTSLLRVLEGDDAGDPEETYVETYLPANSMFAKPVRDGGEKQVGFRRFGIRTPRWKFIVNDPIPILDRDDPAPITPAVRARYFSEELHDLRSDPGETTNVIDEHLDLAAAFRQRIAHYQHLATAQSEPLELDKAARERLRSLGYLE